VAAELFVDTSGWYPLADVRNPAHKSVALALREAVAQRRRIVTTNLVVAETHALIMRRIHRTAALQFVRDVNLSPNLVIDSTPEYETAAVRDWLERFEDQDFSLTDAVSFSVMSDRQIDEALAIDHHFSIAGFTRIPR